MKEECSLCGEIFSYYHLRRCYRCGKLYCRNCLIFSWNKNFLRNVPICLNCARRFVSARRLGTKYSPLSEHLMRRARYTDLATLTFAKIESIIGGNLPSSASLDTRWWNNTPSRVQAQAWLNVGWRVHNVNLNDRTVTFKRVASPEMEKRKKRRKRLSATAAGKPFRPPKPSIFLRRRPSETRIAKAWARLKNVEYRKLSMRRYRGKFKPQPALEKRLYKPEAKPEK
ncbi:MAG: FYVE zinc finger domain-containing protein [Candidatus Bathyarchaeaceae archaeon]